MRIQTWIAGLLSLSVIAGAGFAAATMSTTNINHLVTNPWFRAGIITPIPALLALTAFAIWRSGDIRFAILGILVTIFNIIGSLVYIPKYTYYSDFPPSGPDPQIILSILALLCVWITVACSAFEALYQPRTE